MVVHLTVNASIANGPETFQNNVYSIHALGKLLPLVEWTFIFIPLLFHAIFGVVIVAGGVPNTSHYPYSANWRYTLQRATGIIAFFFIMYHVLHMHGWFHAGWWLDYVAKPLGGAQFRPYNAPSTAGAALQGWLMVSVYAIGVLASVFHLANGIWTMGITWGVWTSPLGQKRALRICTVFGLVLAVIGMTGLVEMRKYGSKEKIAEIQEIESRMYDARVEAGSVLPDEHKRIGDHDHDPSDSKAADNETVEADLSNGPQL